MAAHHHGSRSERRVLDALIKLRRAANTVSARGTEAIREFGLTESQFGVLEALFHLGPLCQKDLASKILKSTGNLTTVIDNLERRDLVARRRDAEDRRMVIVHLTDTGRELVRTAFPRHVAALIELFSVLSPDQQDALAELCRRLGRQERD